MLTLLPLFPFLFVTFPFFYIFLFNKVPFSHVFEVTLRFV